MYERGISLNVTSKVLGLPGLRIGWIASHDAELLQRMMRLKHYLSICSAGPIERLAVIALENREQIIGRNCEIIDENLPKWDAFFAAHTDLFEWYRPDGSCMGFPRYLGADGVETFCRRLVAESGVFLLPSSIYRTELSASITDRFRPGYGRRNLDAGLDALTAHIERTVSPGR